MQATAARQVADRSGIDQASLAFVKCHVTSFVAWDLIRSLADRIGYWSTAAGLGRSLSHPLARVEATLEALATDGVIERRVTGDGLEYRIAADDPTSIVAKRLVSTAATDQNLRVLLVANILSRS
jgi:hypothetical protein